MRSLVRASRSALRERPGRAMGPVLLVVVAATWNAEAVLFLGPALRALAGAQRELFVRAVIMALDALWLLVALMAVLLSQRTRGPVAFASDRWSASPRRRAVAALAGELAPVCLFGIAATECGSVVLLMGVHTGGLVTACQLHVAFIRCATAVTGASIAAHAWARRHWSAGYEATAGMLASAVVVIASLAPAVLWRGDITALSGLMPSLVLTGPDPSWSGVAVEVGLLGLVLGGSLAAIGSRSFAHPRFRLPRWSGRPAWLWHRDPIFASYLVGGGRHPLATVARIASLVMGIGAVALKLAGVVDASMVMSLAFLAVALGAAGSEPVRQEFSKIILLRSADGAGGRWLAARVPWMSLGTTILFALLVRVPLVVVLPPGLDLEVEWLRFCVQMVIAMELAAAVAGERVQVTAGRSVAVAAEYAVLAFATSRVGSPLGVVGGLVLDLALLSGIWGAIRVGVPRRVR